MRFLLVYLLAAVGASSAAERPSYCKSCESKMDMVKLGLLFGADYVKDQAATTIRDSCADYGFTNDFCESGIKNMLPHVVEFIDKASNEKGMSSEDICSLISGCDHPGAPQYQKKYKWTVELPPKTGDENRKTEKPPVPPNQEKADESETNELNTNDVFKQIQTQLGTIFKCFIDVWQNICEWFRSRAEELQKTSSDPQAFFLADEPMRIKEISEPNPLRVLQLADLHIDDQYATGAKIHCLSDKAPGFVADFYQCCRGEPSKDPSNAAGFWGTTKGSCDIPFRTFESALRFIKERDMKFDYILLSGDLFHHDIVKYSMEQMQNQLKNVTKTISWYIPDTPIYFTPGNHEAVPVNAYSYKKEKEEVPQGWLYTEMDQLMSAWVPAEQRTSLRLHGSYSTTPRPGLKIIHLNNNFCYDLNFYSYLNPVDPGGAMKFLVDELYASEQNGERVHIHAHIPPNSNCIQSWSDNYAAVLDRFKETIVFQIHGHEHIEQHQIYFDEHGEPIAVNWGAPSLTTWSNVNPGFRIYVFDGNSFEVISSSRFHAEVDDVGEHESLEWKETDTLEEYGLEDFSPRSWLKYVEKLEKSEKDRSKYARSVYRGSKWQKEECDDRCARRLVCKNRQSRRNSTACL